MRRKSGSVGRWRYLLSASFLVWLPPVWGLAAEVAGKFAAGTTVSEYPLAPAACVPIAPFLIPNVSLKYHPTQRVGVQFEGGYVSTSAKAKQESKDKSDDDSQEVSILGVGARVLGNAVQGPHHNLFVSAGPVYFSGDLSEGDEKSSFTLYGLLAGAGAEIFPPNIPQVGVSLELGMRYIKGTMKTSSSTQSSSSSSTESEVKLSQLGLRGGLATLGLHYYFGKTAGKGRKEIPKGR